MRILQLVSAFAWSGPAPATLALCAGLKELGHDVVVGHDTVRPHGNEHEEGIGPRVATMGIPVAGELALSTRSGPVAWLQDRARLRERLTRVDVVHTHFSHDHVLAVAARGGAARPILVRTIHSERSLRKRAGQRALLHRADALIVHGGALKERACADFGLAREKVHVIGGPVDVDRFHGAEVEGRCVAFRRRHGLPEDAPLIAMVAIFQQGRGHDLVVEAWRQVSAQRPEAHLVFAGLGELRDGVMARVQEHGVPRVHFVGYLDQDLPDLYVAAHASVVLAIGNDGYARAVLESLASGTPVIVSDVSPMSDVVHAASFGRVITDARRDLAGAIVAELDRPVDGRALAAAAAQGYVRSHHAPGAITRAHDELYARLLASSRG